MTTMSEAELTQTILDLVSDIAPEVDPKTIDPNEPLQRALDIDSYDFLNLLVAIRDHLGVTVAEPDYDQVSTVAKMVRFLLPRLESRESSSKTG